MKDRRGCRVRKPLAALWKAVIAGITAKKIRRQAKMRAAGAEGHGALVCDRPACKPDAGRLAERICRVY